jgi:hypothetical protein
VVSTFLKPYSLRVVCFCLVLTSDSDSFLSWKTESLSVVDSRTRVEHPMFPALYSTTALALLSSLEALASCLDNQIAASPNGLLTAVLCNGNCWNLELPVLRSTWETPFVSSANGSILPRRLTASM